MRWKGRRGSDNVEDRRGGGRGVAVGGGVVGLLVMVVFALMGGDPNAVAGLVGGGAPSSGPGIQDEGREFVSVVLADTEEVWSELFAEMGRTYEEPKLVLFEGQVQSACGVAGASVGPFYCPPDQSIYIDLAFYQDLKDRFGAPGDFAQAYVIAHEVGHHVQNLTGVLDRADRAKERSSEREANRVQVRVELMADYLAGVWARHAQRMAELDEQDIREAITAASAIGDDKIQMQAQGYVVPDSFTHGSSDQRMEAFLRGWREDPAGRFAMPRL